MSADLVERFSVWLASVLSFTMRNTLPRALRNAAKFAGFFVVCWVLKWTDILAPGISQGNDLIVLGLLIFFLPMVAAAARRLADTRAPFWLVFMPFLFFAAAETSEVLFNFDAGAAVFWPLGYAACAVILVGFFLPSRPLDVSEESIGEVA